MKHKRSLYFNQIMRKTNKYRNLCRSFKKNIVKKLSVYKLNYQHLTTFLYL